ncbi:MAG TPA: efflux RND transporter periplasmic adaptor subunit [Caulobacteraceae bacterium]
MILCVAGATVAAAGAVNLLAAGRSRPAAAPPAAQTGVFRPTADQMKSLTVAPVETRVFDQVETAEGRIEPNGDRTTPVVSPFTGQVIQVLAEPGQKVTRRTPLFAVAATEAVQGRADLASAIGALATAQAQARLAHETEQRQGDLYRSAGGALKDWREAQNAAIAADGQVRAAEAALGSARSRLLALGQSEADVAALEKAPASRAVAARAVVYAPVDGVVTRRALGPGQSIAAGGDALFSVSDLSSVWLTAQLPETSAGKVRPGAEVAVTTPAYPGRVFRAKVSYVAPALDPDTHRLAVRAVIANADGALKPEMSARFRIDSGALGRSAAAPEAAVIREGDTARVWTVEADGSLRIRPVTVGVVQDGMVQITQGLRPGDRVVAKGALFVDQAGQPD